MQNFIFKIPFVISSLMAPGIDTDVSFFFEPEV